jgi:hypothetical protein
MPMGLDSVGGQRQAEVSSKCALRRGDTAKPRGTLGVVMITTILGSARLSAAV